MKLNKIKNIVGALAPTLGAAIGGPLGGQAGSILSAVLGVPNNPRSLEQALNNITSEQIVELRKAEKEFDLKMKELEVDIYSLQNEDIQDAREKFSSDLTPKILGIMCIVGFFSYVGLVTLRPQPDASDDIVMLVIGSMTGIATAVVSFYFGSSNKKD